MKIIAVDIGNTSITCARVTNRSVDGKFSFLTGDKAYTKLKRSKLFGSCSPVIISSVVPEATKRFIQAMPKGCHHVFVVGKNLKVPIVNRTQFPKQVGQDRLVNAYQAFLKYRSACIAVDFGTAITFDVVSKKGEYLGGIISPGVELTLNALFEKTALLPKIRLQHPKALVGRNTVESIRSGCSYGLGALCDGILERLLKQLPKPCPIIATGGYAPYIRRYSKLIKTVDENLTLKGLYSICHEQEA